MKSLKRVGTMAALALCLAVASASANPAAAASTSYSHSSAIEFACGQLGDAIKYLESRPSSAIRNFILRIARNTFTRYCS